MTRILQRLFMQGVKDLGINPLAQFFTLTAVTLVAFLSGLFLMALTTLNYQLGTTRGETAFQVYWRVGTNMDEVRSQWAEFANMPGYTHVKTYTPEQALEELDRRMDKSRGSFPVLSEKSPLPPTALVFFVPDNVPDVEKFIQDTAGYLQNLPNVERVITTPLRDELGQAWRRISHYVMWPSVVFLTLVLGLVVGNTVRLSLLSRGHEMEILQMVGAQNWYIRFPLVVSGGLTGLIGGALGLGLLALAHSQLRHALYFPPLLMEVHFLPHNLCLALVLVPCLTGMAASWLAVRD